MIVDNLLGLLRAYTPQQQAAINQYGYLPVGWGGAPIVMPPVPAPAPPPPPTAPVQRAVAPRFLGPPIQVAPTSTAPVASPAPAPAAPLSFTGGGSAGGFDPSALTIAQQNLVTGAKPPPTAAGGGLLALLVAGAAALMGSG